MNENPNLGILASKTRNCQVSGSVAAEVTCVDLLGTIVATVSSPTIPTLHRTQKVLVERQECIENKSCCLGLAAGSLFA